MQDLSILKEYRINIKYSIFQIKYRITEIYRYKHDDENQK